MHKPLLLLAPFALIACSQAEPPAAPSEQSPQDAFWTSLSAHCGKAYAGQLVTNDAADADMQGAEMLMHVRTCSNEQITVPFHIKQTGGEWDRSRTWVLTRTSTDGSPGLRLKHDHRHEDGESDAVTMYGGDTADAGTAVTQSFPVDQYSIDMFKREGLDVSVTNVWSVEVSSASDPSAQFAYHLKRRTQTGAREDRNFRVEFDLANPVEPPPAPWGF